MKMNDHNQAIIQSFVYHLRENEHKLAVCLNKINQDELWQSPYKGVVSIGHQTQHLMGNMRQWILHGVCGDADVRNRPLEFTESSDTSAGLISQLSALIDEVELKLSRIEDADLLKVVDVQGYVFTGTGKIIHVNEHVSYHVGQIVLLIKRLGYTVDFYPHV